MRPRLAGVASFVPEGSLVADIGTEHAHLPLFLVKEKECSKVVSIEKSLYNFNAACKKIEAQKMKEKVELRLGSGLLPLTDKDGVEVVVIAGLGGKTICSMLNEAADKLKFYRRLVLQPMIDSHLVRRWLAAHGFFFPCEKLVKEKHHFYEIIASERGSQAVSDPFYLELGPSLLQSNDPLLVPFLRQKLKQCESIIAAMSNSKNKKENARLRYINYRYDRLKGVLKSVSLRE